MVPVLCIEKPLKVSESMFDNCHPRENGDPVNMDSRFRGNDDDL